MLKGVDLTALLGLVTPDERDDYVIREEEDEGTIGGNMRSTCTTLYRC